MSEENRPAPSRARPDPLAPRTALPTRPMPVKNRQPLVQSPPRRHNPNPTSPGPRASSSHGQTLPASPAASSTNVGGQGSLQNSNSQKRSTPGAQAGQVCRYVRPSCGRAISMTHVPHPISANRFDSNCGTTRTPLWRRSPQGATICNACGLYQKARNTARPTKLNRTGISLASEPRASPPKPSTPAAKGSKCGSGSTYFAADQVSTGTCPGGGRCNGTGGAEGCNGCPAFNNRLSKRAQLNTKGQASSAGKSAESSEAQPIDIAALKAEEGQSNTPMVIACQNCATTITPLWRRDEGGHTICNACGMFPPPSGRLGR